jgi:cytochrome c oxidase assembly protein subunit 15
VALHGMAVPERVRKSARILVIVMVAQAAVGYTQYFTHLPALLVEVHVAGATAIVVGTVHFFLSFTRHPAGIPSVVPAQAGSTTPWVAAPSSVPSNR